MPRVTIVIPHAPADRLEALPDALLSQSLPDWQAVLVSDGTAQIPRTLSEDHRICQASLAAADPAVACNHGALLRAKAELIAFLRPGDLWAPGKLSRMLRLFAEPGIAAAYGQVGCYTTDPEPRFWQPPAPVGTIAPEQLGPHHPGLCLSNIVLRRRALAETGGFDSDAGPEFLQHWLRRLTGGGYRLVGLPDLQTFCAAGLGSRSDG